MPFSWIQTFFHTKKDKVLKNHNKIQEHKLNLKGELTQNEIGIYK